MLKHRTQSTALVPIDDDVDNLPFIVRRDHRIVAAFARKASVGIANSSFYLLLPWRAPGYLTIGEFQLPHSQAAIEGGRDALVERREPLHRPHRGGCDRCLLGRSTARRMPLNHGR